MRKKKFISVANDVISLEIKALQKLKKNINDSFNKAVIQIAKCQSKVILCGVGKSGLIASKIAAKIYNLKVLNEKIQDNKNNTTRFLIMEKKPRHFIKKEKKVITSILFQVRNIPAALYKAMGGFATNNVNMIKLESSSARPHIPPRDISFISCCACTLHKIQGQEQ